MFYETNYGEYFDEPDNGVLVASARPHIARNTPGHQNSYFIHESRPSSIVIAVQSTVNDHLVCRITLVSVARIEIVRGQENVASQSASITKPSVFQESCQANLFVGRGTKQRATHVICLSR